MGPEPFLFSIKNKTSNIRRVVTGEVPGIFENVSFNKFFNLRADDGTKMAWLICTRL